MLDSAKKVENVFRFCCILHNWILEKDGADNIGQAPSDYKSAVAAEVHKDLADASTRELLNSASFQRSLGGTWEVSLESDLLRVGGIGSQSVAEEVFEQEGFNAPKDNDMTPEDDIEAYDAYGERQKALIVHYAMAASKNNIKRLRTREEIFPPTE